MTDAHNERGDQLYSDAEIARRRDEVVRRMANTPPRPRKTKDHPRRKAKPTASDRAAHKRGAGKAT